MLEVFTRVLQILLVIIRAGGDETQRSKAGSVREAAKSLLLPQVLLLLQVQQKQLIVDLSAINN
jgi:hypothetical protein